LEVASWRSKKDNIMIFLGMWVLRLEGRWNWLGIMFGGRFFVLAVLNIQVLLLELVRDQK